MPVSITLVARCPFIYVLKSPRGKCLNAVITVTTQLLVRVFTAADGHGALQVRDILANPDAYASTAGPAAEETAEETPKEEEAKAEEEEEEEDDDMGFSLFD